jgi:hypothetical protein
LFVFEFHTPYGEKTVASLYQFHTPYGEKTARRNIHYPPDLRALFQVSRGDRVLLSLRLKGPSYFPYANVSGEEGGKLC